MLECSTLLTPYKDPSTGMPQRLTQRRWQCPPASDICCLTPKLLFPGDLRQRLLLFALKSCYDTDIALPFPQLPAAKRGILAEDSAC